MPNGEAEQSLPAYVTQLYSHEELRGTITLSVREQIIEYWFYGSGATYREKFQLQASGAGFTVATFTSLGSDTLLLGGYKKAETKDEVEVADLAVLSFDPRGKGVRVDALKWRGPKPAAVIAMDLFPNGQQVALLDTFSSRVLVLDLETRIMREVANSIRAPKLRMMKYVHVWAYPGSDHPEEEGKGVLIWVTSVPERDVGTGILVGPSVSIIDADGDGVFEHVR